MVLFQPLKLRILGQKEKKFNFIITLSDLFSIFTDTVNNRVECLGCDEHLIPNPEVFGLLVIGDNLNQVIAYQHGNDDYEVLSHHSDHFAGELKLGVHHRSDGNWRIACWGLLRL